MRGDVRSYFAMTERAVSGSDPTGLQTRAVLDGDEWVIDGDKWFQTGADGAAFGIVMAVTDPDDAPHRHISQIIVPADTPGVEVVRPVPVLGHTGHGWNTHCEVRFRERARARSRTCSASAATASRSRRSASARVASTTSCAGSGRCSAPST